MKIDKSFVESMNLEQLKEYVFQRVRTKTGRKALELLITKNKKGEN